MTQKKQVLCDLRVLFGLFNCQTPELGQYSVSVYPEHLNALYEAGDVKQMDQELMVLTNPNLYTEETGLSLEADFGKALFG